MLVQPSPVFRDNRAFRELSRLFMSIRLIVGLGNPGPEYEQTRHNAGFWLVDNLANTLPGCRLQRESRFNAMVAKTSIAGKEVWLLEPLTFMNRSGQSVGALARFFKIAPDEVLVVHDELDLMPGAAKLKKGGSSGGHNGLKDITAGARHPGLLAPAPRHRPSAHPQPAAGRGRLRAAPPAPRRAGP
jgi:hypothetical protein